MEAKKMMEELRKPFKASEVEWLPKMCGVGGTKEEPKPWVKVLAYIDARAIQNRLDDVFGVGGWKTDYDVYDKGMICELIAKIDGEWVSKKDGASETNFEPFKGGLSGAFKRVASSGFGIGRYLYKVEIDFADICTLKKPSYNDKKNWEEAYDKKNKVSIYWKPPVLPKWALPEGEPKQKQEKQEKPVVLSFIPRENVIGIKTLVGKHKNLEKDILASYGLTSASQIQDYQYQEIYNKIKNAIIEIKKHEEAKEQNKSVFGDKRFLDIVGVDTPITINCDYKGKTPAEVYEIDPGYIKFYAENGHLQTLKAVCCKMMEKVN